MADRRITAIPLVRAREFTLSIPENGIYRGIAFSKYDEPHVYVEADVGANLVKKCFRAFGNNEKMIYPRGKRLVWLGNYHSHNRTQTWHIYEVVDY